MSKQPRTGIQKMENAVTAAPEQTWPGPVYSPAVDIFENDHAITVLADLPGVRARDLKIDLQDGVLALTGRLNVPDDDGQPLLREFEPGTFFREFTLGEAIEQGKIDAKLTDGVLRLELPKTEKARPRQIVVRTD